MKDSNNNIQSQSW